jgi:hypothetical protein
MTQTARGGRSCEINLSTLCRCDRAVVLQGFGSLGIVVVDHDLMFVRNQTARNIAAHASKTDYPDLHVQSPITPAPDRTPLAAPPIQFRSRR